MPAMFSFPPVDEDYFLVDEIIDFVPTTLSSAIDCIRVRFIDDNVPEPNEMLRLTLSEASCAISRVETIVTIGSELL